MTGYYHIAAESTASGVSQLGLNLTSFVFQLITFVIVLIILKKFVFKKLMKTLDSRQNAVEQSLKNYEDSQKALSDSKQQSIELISKTQNEVKEMLESAEKSAETIIKKAESKSLEEAARVINATKEQLLLEKEQLRRELKKELSVIVAEATEMVIGEKLTNKHDQELIESSIKKVEL